MPHLSQLSASAKGLRVSEFESMNTIEALEPVKLSLIMIFIESFLRTAVNSITGVMH